MASGMNAMVRQRRPKALVVNRVGDFFGPACLASSAVLGHRQPRLRTSASAQQAPGDGSVLSPAAVIHCLLVFMGRGNRPSFRFMSGLPTPWRGPPISALIHAATMVAAGVFLVAPSAIYIPFEEAAGLHCPCIGTITCFGFGADRPHPDGSEEGWPTARWVPAGLHGLGWDGGPGGRDVSTSCPRLLSRPCCFSVSGSVIHAMEEVVGTNRFSHRTLRLMGVCASTAVTATPS